MFSKNRDHCSKLIEIGLNPFEIKSGKWEDYFTLDGPQLPKSGQHGQVLLVKDNENGEKYALKLFKKELSEDDKKRLVLLIQFSKENAESWPKSLVRYVAAYRFTDSNQSALLMNRVDGISLKDLIIPLEEMVAKNKNYSARRVPTNQWKCWMKDIFDALEFFHSHGIAHRDVHAENIMILKDGKGAVLVDHDLMCLPYNSTALCQSLCFGASAKFSTAPDIWCYSSSLGATPEQWFKSDVWGAAQAFLSYVSGRENVLAKKIPLGVGKGDHCKTPSNERVSEAVSSALWYVDLADRPFWRKLLNPDWKTRPSAAEASQMMGKCTDREDFKVPLSKQPSSLSSSASLLESGEEEEEENGYVPEFKKMSSLPVLLPSQAPVYEY